MSLCSPLWSPSAPLLTHLNQLLSKQEKRVSELSSEEATTRQRALRAERREAALKGEIEHFRIKLADAEDQRDGAKKVATDRKRKLQTLNRRTTSLQAMLEAAHAESKERADEIEELKSKLEIERKKRKLSDRTSRISSILSAQMVGIDADDDGQQQQQGEVVGDQGDEATARKDAVSSPTPSLVDRIAVTPSPRYRSASKGRRQQEVLDTSALAISMNASKFLSLLDGLVGLHISAVSSIRQHFAGGRAGGDGAHPARGLF